MICDKPLAVAAIDVLYDKAQRAIFARLRALERAERLEQRRTFPPQGERTGLHNAVPAARRNRHDRSRLHAQLIEKCAHFGRALLVRRLWIARQIELVDRDEHICKTEPA